MKRFIKSFAILISFIVMLSVSVDAASVTGICTPSYDFNDYNESVTAPAGYQYSGDLEGKVSGLNDSFKEPKDMSVVDSYLYLLDSGNSRVVKIDLNTEKIIKVYDDFTYKNGEKVSFNGANGISVSSDGKMYIADTENKRILICDKDEKVINVITRPDKVLVDNDFPFRVTKIQVGRYGEIYAIVEGIDLGILVFKEDGEFSTFVGSNKVATTGEVLFNYFMKRFMSLEQLQTRIKSTPLLVNNFCMDSRGFIYTVSSNSKSFVQDGMVRCLNYESNNILLTGTTYGDLEHSIEDLTGAKTKFTAVDVDENNFLYLLDNTKGRVFVYSDDGFLISEFGARGDQKGTFGQPEDIAEYNGNIYVLDSVKKRIHKFTRTEYAKTFFEAKTAFNRRDFNKSLELWQKASTLNTNSLYPYYGMAMVYDSLGEYEKAMENYHLSGKKIEYSDVFREYRKEWLKHNGWIVALAAAFIIAIVTVIGIQYKKALKCTDSSVYSVSEQNALLFPLYILLHPIDGADQFRRRNIHNMKVAGIIIIAWFGVSALGFYKTGFIFNSHRSSEFNPAAIIISTAGLYALFVISNWCVSTFLDGKGKLKEIACITAYALIPYVVSLLCKVGLSNVLSLSESIFLDIIGAIGIIWSLVVLIMGMYSLHQYSFSKTLFSLLFTLFGMLIIVFLIIMFYTLIKQGIDFLSGLYQEAIL